MAPVTAASHSAESNGIISTVLKKKEKKERTSSYVSKNYKKESKRLKTFTHWPVSFINPKDLAKNGFYFTNVDDVVKCAFCKTQIGFWEEGDDPNKDHLKLSPMCPFLRNEPCGNVPLSEEGNDRRSRGNSNDENGDDDDDDDDDEDEDEEPESQDVCGTVVIRPFSEPERSHRSAFSIDSTNLWKDFEELGVTKIYEPVAPNYATYASRIKTFDKWEAHNIQKPEKLAEAGFYYIGHEDNVICFHCGGGLKDWEKDEDPWVEHARWFSKCRFVFLQKGRDFINEVTAREIINRSKKHDSAVKKTNESSSSSSSSTEQSQSETSSSDDEKVLDGGKSKSMVPKVETKVLPSDGKEIQLCIVCYSRERGIVFLPCGHFVCCPQCTSSLTKCAVCREPFKATVRAYFC
ncbi:inhibitor of apoptosis 1, diap1, putative [Pediculus humanus corporis]|uniref:Inhibitor of apoptosis 1, diap1, putative n=1 Tax=Pediculus humanus subsp. corporis TaxID=121224 RepID=E0VJZ7_PEDHC|nr:inhibitor of apoptosis 1, diap1, putative [Pediculus humanus corporis]EEB13703.1 inhibitor of apoptosis 1, diap1, putative [Pediculus humanus corporis]